MKKIKLLKGELALVDDLDFKLLSQWKWYLCNGYAVRRYKQTMRMHRVINNTPEGFVTDHINGNKLDNRRKNLRTVTKSQNAMNTKINSNNTSGYKGIYWDKFTKKWRAEIKLDYKKISLGRFINLKDAILARREGEIKYHAI